MRKKIFSILLLFVILFGFTVVAIYTIISLATGYEIPLYENVD